MTLEEAINQAAKELPEGWIIELSVENGSGWVDIYDPDGEKTDIQNDGESTLADDVLSAITYAKEHQGKYE